jgi:hypothetical protein
MNWPKEIENNTDYDNAKAIFALVSSDDWFLSCEVFVNSPSKWNENGVYTLNCIKVTVNGDDDHYFNYRNSNCFCYSFNKITKNGNSVRSHYEMFEINDAEKALKRMKELITLDRQADEFLKREESKQKQMEDITSIIIDGISAKYPKVKAALDAKHRGAKNFLDHEFKKKKLIIHAKLTIEDRQKLDKLFQVLEEIV